MQQGNTIHSYIVIARAAPISPFPMDRFWHAAAIEP